MPSMARYDIIKPPLNSRYGLQASITTAEKLKADRRSKGFFTKKDSMDRDIISQALIVEVLHMVISP